MKINKITLSLTETKKFSINLDDDFKSFKQKVMNVKDLLVEEGFSEDYMFKNKTEAYGIDIFMQHIEKYGSSNIEVSSSSGNIFFINNILTDIEIFAWDIVLGHNIVVIDNIEHNLKEEIAQWKALTPLGEKMNIEFENALVIGIQSPGILHIKVKN